MKKREGMKTNKKIENIRLSTKKKSNIDAIFSTQKCFLEAIFKTATKKIKLAWK